MKATIKLISAVSVTAMAFATVTPALAFVTTEGFVPVDEARQNRITPYYGPFNKDTGSALRSERPVDQNSDFMFDEDDSRELTSRRIARLAERRNSRLRNRTEAEGVESRQRSEATPGFTGRFYLPYRTQAVRFQRNENRHYLGLRRPGGQYRRTVRERASQGDLRIRPVGIDSSISAQANVLMGPDDRVNSRRAARGNEDGDSSTRNINRMNRR